MAPPTARRAAKRALVLCAVTMRAYLEGEGAADTPEYHQRMLAWLDGQPLGDEFERAERSFVWAPIGKLSKKKVTEALWRSEGLGVLAWSLGRAQLPAPHEEVDQQKTAKGLGFMHEPIVLKGPKLRGLAERRHHARLARAIHWRLRELRRTRKRLDLQQVASVLPLVAPLLEGDVPLVEGDLRLGRRAAHRATPGEIQHALSIAAERHLAFGWLVGAEAIYSEVDTPT